MRNAIFVAVIPTQTNEWRGFLADATQKLTAYQGIKRLAENVWLIDLQKSRPALRILSELADSLGISAGTLLFEYAPAWLPADFDPTPLLTGC
jgi:DNA transposition AAA+ family ATPase